jgi:dipeptidyl-peptidase-4
MKLTYLFLALSAGFLTLSAARAQDAPRAKGVALDTSFLRNYAETRGFMLGRPVKAKPTPDGKAVLFLRAQARVPKLRLYEFDVATGKTREVLTPEALLKGAEEKLTPEEKARRERQRVSVGGFTDFQISHDGKLILLSLSGKPYIVRRADGDVRELAVGKGTFLDPKFSPDGKHISYVLDHDLYVLALADGKERRLTRGGSEKLTHGLAEFVAQEEMSRHTGYWWSPDSKHLAYEESDADGVEVWYVADPAHPEQQGLASYYPRPGKSNVKVRLGIIPVTGGDTVWLDWDREKYPYLTRVNWPKKGPMTIGVQTREQHEVALLKVDPATGKTASLLTEKDAAWVNLESGVPRWFGDGKQFLWISETGGGPRLELRGDSGDLVRVLVPPEQGFENLIDVNPEAGLVYYRASTDPTQAHLFVRPLKAEDARQLSKEPGQHGATFAKNHSIYVHTAALADAMPRTTAHKADGTLIGTLESVAETPPFTPKYEILKVGEGKGFYASIVRPRDFDEKKRYPVLVDVYGGPGHQKVIAAQNSRLLYQWIADQGFLVVAVDGRGTPGRGRDWERALYLKFGSVPLEDQVAGVKALAAKVPQMDLERVGIVGWSFGGYMSALAVLRQPDFFKAAVAGAPVVDWLDYDTHYTERYLGLPEKEKEAYKEGSLLTYAAELRRPLLLIHGTADDNVYFRHSLRLANALFRAGKDFEMLPLSGLTHMVPDPVVTERLWSRVVLHFHQHLGKPK